MRESFLAALPAEIRAAWETDPNLEQVLGELEQSARETYPTVELDQQRLARALGERVGAGAPLSALHAADVFLAEACGTGNDAAIATLLALVGSDLDRVLDRSPSLGVSRGELRQLALVHLLAAEPGEQPRILSYRGRGTLRGWVRVVGARLVLDLARRRDGEHSALEPLADLAASGGDPELDYLRHAYAELVPGAFTVALKTLTVRQRNLLRQRYLHDVPARQLATFYGVGRSTVFDWIARAQRELLAEVRRALAQKLHERDVESVLELLGSQLDVSIRTLLASQLEPESKKRDGS